MSPPCPTCAVAGNARRPLSIWPSRPSNCSLVSSVSSVSSETGLLGWAAVWPPCSVLRTRPPKRLCPYFLHRGMQTSRQQERAGAQESAVRVSSTPPELLWLMLQAAAVLADMHLHQQLHLSCSGCCSRLRQSWLTCTSTLHRLCFPARARRGSGGLTGRQPQLCSRVEETGVLLQVAVLLAGLPEQVAQLLQPQPAVLVEVGLVEQVVCVLQRLGLRGGRASLVGA